MRYIVLNIFAAILLILGLGNIPEIAGWTGVIRVLRNPELWRVMFALFGIIIVILVDTRAGAWVRVNLIREQKNQQWKHFKQWDHIVGKKYANEDVVIDGKFFDRCEFTNVSLMFNGTGPVKIENPLWHGGVGFKSTYQPAITAAQVFALVYEISRTLTGRAPEISTIDDSGKRKHIDINPTKLK